LFLDPNPGKGLAHQNLNKFMWKHLDLLKLWEILDVDRLTRIKNPRVKKLELRIRIRDPVLFWPMYPGSGIGFFRIQDLGFRILNPYFWELIDNFLSKKNYNSLKIDQTFFLWHFKIKYFSIMWDLCCAANFLALLNLPTAYSFLMISPNLHGIWAMSFLILSCYEKLVLLILFRTLGDGYSL
jgi:hypothetical protein